MDLDIPNREAAERTVALCSIRNTATSQARSSIFVRTYTTPHTLVVNVYEKSRVSYEEKNRQKGQKFPCNKLLILYFCLIRRLTKKKLSAKIIKSVSNETEGAADMNIGQGQKNALLKCFLYAALPEEDRNAIFSSFSSHSFKKDEPIYTQHNFIKSLGIIMEGEAAVYNESGTLLNVLKPGNCFGAAALFSQTEEYVTSVIAKKKCIVLFISDGELKELFIKYPQTALSYLSFLSGRIQFLNRKIDAFTNPKIENAVWNWLLTQADDMGTVHVSMGYTALARTFSVGRASLYRALAELQNEGKIIKNGAEIQICRRTEQEEKL